MIVKVCYYILNNDVVGFKRVPILDEYEVKLPGKVSSELISGLQVCVPWTFQYVELLFIAKTLIFKGEIHFGKEVWFFKFHTKILLLENLVLIGKHLHL